MNTYQGKPCRNGHDGTRYLSTKACVSCARAAVRKHQKENPGKSQHLKRGLDFNIDMSDLVVPELCPVLGIPMDKPSIDRVDNDKGYVKGNVAVISDRANRLKRDATLGEVQALARWMEAQSRSAI